LKGPNGPLLRILLILRPHFLRKSRQFFIDVPHLGYVTNVFIGDLKSALVLDGEMIHLKTRKPEICTAPGDLPLTNILLPPTAG
jgi:hypothetical protein